MYCSEAMQSLLLSLMPGHAVIPKYYHVPADFVEAEQNKHGSQKRFPSNSGRDGKLFLWGQALYNIAKLLGMSTSVLDVSVYTLISVGCFINNAKQI